MKKDQLERNRGPQSQGRKRSWSKWGRAAVGACMVAVATGSLLLDENGAAAVASAARDPMGLLAQRSPGARGAGALLQSKSERVTSAPIARTGFTARNGTPQPAAGPADEEVETPIEGEGQSHSPVGGAPYTELSSNGMPVIAGVTPAGGFAPFGGGGGGVVGGGGGVGGGPAGGGGLFGGQEDLTPLTYVPDAPGTPGKPGTPETEFTPEKPIEGGPPTSDPPRVKLPPEWDPKPPITEFYPLDPPRGDGVPPTAPIPEPATWAMLILGFFTVGAMVRRNVRRSRAANA